MKIDVQHLVDGMDGIVYVLDRQALVVTIGAANWNAFADANGGEHLHDGDGVVGRSIYSFISGDSVRDSYERCFNGVFSGRLHHAHLETRCDSPGTMRLLRLSVTPILGDDAVDYVLVQSIAMVERVRPYMSLFDFESLRAKHALGRDLPLLTMCSYCQQVRFPAGSDETEGEWVTAEDYYRRGGVADVSISHGMCDPCFDKALDSLAA